MEHSLFAVGNRIGPLILLAFLSASVATGQENILAAQQPALNGSRVMFDKQGLAPKDIFAVRSPVLWTDPHGLSPAVPVSGPRFAADPVPPPPAAPGDEGNSCDEPDDNHPTDEKLYTDCRGVFNASFYIGLAIDAFAGDDTLSLLYRNPGASGQVKERAVGGFDFAYRLFGDKTPMVSETGNHSFWRDPHQSLWIYGETVHGVRSADVNCKNNPNLPVCQSSLIVATDPSTQIYYILRNATSLEGFTGLRWEFKELQTDSDTPSRLYLKAQAGFLSIAGASGGTYAMHHLALGAIATKGRFENSYLEAGWGRSDTFAMLQHRRVKVDGFLQWKIPTVTQKTGLSAFAEMLVDTSLGRGSNSIQSYVGINYDLDKFLGTVKK